MGAVVSLLDGAPDKARYRTYHVHTVSGGDDYGALLEVLRRRFRRAAEVQPGASDDTWQLPDLFVIDGGRGQLAIALTAAGDLGIDDLSIVGLAKEKETAQGEKVVDRVYLPGQKNPIALRPGSPELFFLARARDEAHRFANRGRSKLGQVRRLESLLDPISGVGPKTKKALFARYDSLCAMQAATDDELLQIPGVSSSVLVGLRQLFSELEGEPFEGEDSDEMEMPSEDGADSAAVGESTTSSDEN